MTKDGAFANRGEFAYHGLHSNQRFNVDGGIVDHCQVSDDKLIADFRSSAV